jgi:peptidoglycan/LPS O-acetylase OafA/YrhL
MLSRADIGGAEHRLRRASRIRDAQTVKRPCPQAAAAERVLLCHHNNFNLVRIMCAATVCLVHAAALSNTLELAWIADSLGSSTRVQAFFVISGFLIFRSYERAPSTGRFARTRVRRIYPAYCLVVILCAVLLGAVSSRTPFYFSSDWLRYVAANLTFLNFLHPTLPGVFEAHRYTEVNGALWTLKIEMMFYATVPLFALLFRRVGRMSVIAGTYGLSIGYAMLMKWLASATGSGIYDELGRQLPGQLAYLIGGAFLYYYLPLVHRRRWWWTASSAAVLVAHAFHPLPVLQPLALAVAIVLVSVFIPGPPTRRLGNLPYALFLIHFPIVQVLVHAGYARAHPAIYLTMVMVTVGGGAMVMSHLMDFLTSQSSRTGPRLPAEPYPHSSDWRAQSSTMTALRQYSGWDRVRRSGRPERRSWSTPRSSPRT